MKPRDLRASRTLNSAAPQLIIISRPSGSAAARRRLVSACRLSCDPPPAVNRHGWLLCTEGAQIARATTYRVTSSAVIGLLMTRANSGAPPGGRYEGPGTA